ncbi:hypothetical protein AB5N19_08900 [Seiridium cardinale]|uniref:M protein, serotype 2.1 n=1 Tax=Seiridium cardinale TaxID=138064 RepID=A0ABR2XLD0_9PEZI
MSAAARKPPSAGVNRVSDSNTASTSPARQARASTPTSTASGPHNGAGAGTPTRTRSIRTGTPVSARAAMHRGSSSLSISTTEAEEVVRAEAAAVVEDLKARLEKADATSEQHRKHADVLQSRLDDALKEQAKLEERVHESEEQIETLRNEKRESARQMREMETIYEAEKSKILKEKEEMGNREEEMQAVINRLKDTISQRNAEDEYRPTRQSNNSSPSVDNGNFAPPSSLNRSDSRNNSKLLLQKDKLIESLRLELAEAQIKLVETENQGGGRLHEVERLLMEARMANARLMEDNESYQLLLQERTLHGDFGKGDFSYMSTNANQDALNALEGRPSSGGDKDLLGSSLADELGDVADDSAISHVDDADHQRRLEGELRVLKDQNKALTLYINKIIERLLQHQEFEHILDQSSDSKPGADVNKDLPPPPSEKAGASASFLQRAKSIATGSNAPAPGGRKPRPMSFMPSTTAVHNNPETAPSIPIGLSRSTSTRRPAGRPMSEQYPSAAGIVNAMYKGPDGPMGPISPTLSNPRNSAQFFSGTGTPRVVSGNGAPTAGNFPGMRSETSSVSGESAGDGTSTSQSPPRTVSSGTHSHHGEKQGATFAGNKPRPLRLVQEETDRKAAENKRASWFGNWQTWNAKKPEDGETIKE